MAPAFAAAAAAAAATATATAFAATPLPLAQTGSSPKFYCGIRHGSVIFWSRCESLQSLCDGLGLASGMGLP
jgi:hypothetical protein